MAVPGKFQALVAFAVMVSAVTAMDVKYEEKHSAAITADASVLSGVQLSQQKLRAIAAAAAVAAEAAFADKDKHNLDEDVLQVLKHYKFLQATVRQIGKERRKGQVPAASFVQQEDAQPVQNPLNYNRQPGDGPPQVQPDYRAGYYTGYYQGYNLGYRQVLNYTKAHPNITATADNATKETGVLASPIQTLAQYEAEKNKYAAMNQYVNGYQVANGLNGTKVVTAAPTDPNDDNAVYIVLYIAIAGIVACAVGLAFVGLVAIEKKYKHSPGKFESETEPYTTDNN